MRKTKIRFGIAWFTVLLMNIGLGVGTVGLIKLLEVYSPIISLGWVAITLSLLYVFFFTLLVVGVVGIDYIVATKGIKHYVNDLQSKEG